jgi:hypothetical protein
MNIAERFHLVSFCFSESTRKNFDLPLSTSFFTLNIFYNTKFKTSCHKRRPLALHALSSYKKVFNLCSPRIQSSFSFDLSVRSANCDTNQGLSGLSNAAIPPRTSIHKKIPKHSSVLSICETSIAPLGRWTKVCNMLYVFETGKNNSYTKY